ncbi:hypothetical protein LXL04_036163 [Taraxacum kok-saghyz]
MSLSQAHRYVLFNVESVSPFREEHKRIVKGQNRSHRLNEYAINKIHYKQFSEWFKKRYREGEAMVKTKVKTEDEPGMEVDALMEMEAGGDKVEFFMA